MDEVLRRRLVGAAVLLAAAFLLASLLPDPGPRGAGGSGQVVTYDLRTGRPINPPPRPEPEPAPTARSQAEPPAAAGPAPPGPAPDTPRPALKVDESLGGTPPGAWYLQIGSFENQANARNVLTRLYGAGLPTTIQTLTSGKKLWYRVRVGPYANEAAAQQALAKVRGQGYPLTKVVKADAGD
jgi:cell division septation protein DedD